MNEPGSTTRPSILVIDDQPELLSAVHAGLEANGFDVLTARDGREGLEVCLSSEPDVVLVDLVMPKVDGLELIRRLRPRSAVPIIVISVHGEEQKKIEALNLGADDYLTKPFGFGELLARIKANLRRAQHDTRSSTADKLVIGDLVIDATARDVSRAGSAIHLTPTEFDLLNYLAEHQGKVLRHRVILAAVWGFEYSEETPSLRVMIRQLRKKIEADPARPRFILTEPGIGYRFLSNV